MSEENNAADSFHLSDRGFKQGEEIIGNYGGTLKVYESSGATPAIWISADEPNDPSGNPRPVPMETTLLLGLDKAALLRDQLDYLIKNHFTHELYYGDEDE